MEHDASYNILKTMTDPVGKKVCVLLLDGLSSILEIKELNRALNMTEILNRNSHSGCSYEVRTCGRAL
tara:strand:- start:268 stop:471 length:204 start_codon:yes stop_codon:yes gene_type:complete